MIISARVPPGVRHERPAAVGRLLTAFEQDHPGTRHTAAFGPDGVLLGHAGGDGDTGAQARAEQNASSCYMLASLTTGVSSLRVSALPGGETAAADHLLLRHRPADARPGSSPWWVVIVPIADSGGLVTEIPDAAVAPQQVLGPLAECAERVSQALAEAHRRAG
ncbi:hypothetical protein ACFVWN_29930 [Nocardiopsis flavescens]|uniref:Roadblock/LC7 domain-containing protein n=1 Tax=Nocardiopsis flavescens TaxID=758803 RepID=A0A1M6CG75_9ACTN|nr:hypothetical protein [Nocardiopsis flavescens]SHI60012.1 hypothetical protein SAMN05421803_101696 [Nocardiopsis flavescens]